MPLFKPRFLPQFSCAFFSVFLAAKKFTDVSIIEWVCVGESQRRGTACRARRRRCWKTWWSGRRRSCLNNLQT